VARRVGAKRRAEELAAVRDILYEDKLGLQRPSMPKSRDSSPKTRRPARLSRRLRGAYPALGLRWWRCLC